MHQNMSRFSDSLCFLIFLFTFVSAVKKSMHPAINVCKRNDPHISECYCRNVETMIPILKDGAPEMGLPPTDPLILETMSIDLTQTQTLRLAATLTNVTLRGMAHANMTHCDFRLLESGYQVHFNMHIPVIKVYAFYNVLGSLSLLQLNSSGDFHAEGSNVILKSTWTGTKYMRNGKVYVKASGEFDEFSVKMEKIEFDHLFGDNMELNANINAAIAENIDMIYDEIKPILSDAVKSISLSMINLAGEGFSEDELFPL